MQTRSSDDNSVRPSGWKSSINTNRTFTTRFPMSLRWSSYTLPLSPPKGTQKRKAANFGIKSYFAWKSLLQNCKAFIGLTIHMKMIGGGDPFYLKFWIKPTALERNRRFSSYFRSKSSINTNRKSITRFSMSLRWTSHVVPIPPRVAQKRSAEIWTISRDEIRCQLLLITNRKSHTGFRLIPTSMTLNDLERRNSPYFAFFYQIRLLCWPITSHWLKIDL